MSTLVKYSFFTVIFVILTWVMTDEVSCALKGDEICLMNFAFKYLVFMVLMVIYDKWLKYKIFKKK
ncbi:MULTISPECIES: hypothetical protein [Myroides]|uniref:Uncharacterized protein n=1 Tax=Myroides albus TaxID=2562892 RepID=A0A6I3LLI7_9FLAO|nr:MULTISPECIES: hypothetical protein [Myroides]MTG97052.1 hypothetical protein [Myroides albus]MVX36011.1 hypothetical protein [Myroides sp. LoEW2-1]UVD78525.1 hypothetical protein NWE55_10320 [Myroides albus]